MAEPETDETIDLSGEIRQYNSRLPVAVYEILRYRASSRNMSLGKLVEEVLTAYAAEELEQAKADARAKAEAADRASKALDRINPEQLKALPSQRPMRRSRAS